MDPKDLGIFILCVLAIIPLIDAVKRWFGKPESRRIYPQPLEVKASPEFMTLADCKRFHEQQEAQFQRMISTVASEFRAVLQLELRSIENTHSARTTELRKEIHASISGVHRRVDGILEALQKGATLKGIHVE